MHVVAAQNTFIMHLFLYCQVGKTFTSAGIAAAAAAAGISVTAGGGISIASGIPPGSTTVTGLTGTINSVANLTSGVMAGITAANVGDLSMFSELSHIRKEQRGVRLVGFDGEQLCLQVFVPMYNILKLCSTYKALLPSGHISIQNLI